MRDYLWSIISFVFTEIFVSVGWVIFDNQTFSAFLRPQEFFFFSLVSVSVAVSIFFTLRKFSPFIAGNLLTTLIFLGYVILTIVVWNPRGEEAQVYFLTALLWLFTLLTINILMLALRYLLHLFDRERNI